MRNPAILYGVGNILENAVDFARKNVEVNAWWNDDTVEIVISDDGPGVPQSMREEVFKPFLRLDDARNQDEGGTGLGLAITRDIARSHGGDITLGDSPMGGLRAIVRIPV